jgi:hypothetical protein
MFAFFLLPVSMAIGGALVSVPIIIHLINRLRFKRIRWAAMEFLLKSQKRNRRRLIIEQILLLLLRCMLVLLAAFLVSRFIGCSAQGFGPKQSSAHFVVLDDTLSQQDKGQDQTGTHSAFDESKRLVKEIAKKASQAGAAQQMRVVKLSDLGTPLFDDRLNDESINRLEKDLDDLKCSDLHIEPQKGVKAALDYFADATNKSGLRLLHFVSDLRSRDWSGQEANALNKDIDSLCQEGVQVNLVDSAHPARADRGVTAPLPHDNFGIVDLRPDTRVAALGMPVQFTVSVQNFTNTEQKNVYLTVRVNGQERLESSEPIPSLPAATLTTHTFLVNFNEKGFNQVTASLPKLPVGLEGDDRRYAVVEVRDQVPVLIIDGSGANGLKPGGDTFYLQTVLSSAKGYQVVPRGVEELEHGNLDQYPSIFLLNVPEIKSEKALHNLEDYVKQGGSVAFFLGDKVRPAYYNDVLYNKGKGLFPAPLADRPSYQKLAEEEEFKKLYLEEQQKLFVRSKHPIFADIFSYQGVFRYLILEGYWPTLPRTKWASAPGTVEELVTLPNEKPLDNFKAAGNQLNQKLQAINEAKFDKWKPGLERHYRAIRDALGGSQLYELALALQALLNDAGDEKNPERPNMKAFWDLPEQATLRQEIEAFRDLVQYGDPLVLTHRFGKGRVVAFLTTAGKGWSKWAGGCPASATYPIVVLELQKFLSSGDEEMNRFVGAPLTIELDAAQYENKMRRYYQPEVQEAPAGTPQPAPGKRAGLTDLGEQLGVADQNKVTLTFDEARKPGVYLFDLFPRQQAGGVEPKPEQRAFVFNVDTLAEGDLKRSSKEELERNPTNAPHDRGKITLYGSRANFMELTQQVADTSQSPWLFLVLLVLLVGEQALAMHLSFHLKSGEALLPAQAMRPQAAA